MPSFCDESYCRMKELKTKKLCIIFNKNMFKISNDINRLISLYICDISIDEYRYYMNLFRQE